MSIVPLLIVGTVLYIQARSNLIQETLDLLESNATLQKANIQQKVYRYIDRVEGVSSRTQLRISLREYISGNQEEIQRIRRILTQAQEPFADIVDIIILAQDGTIITHTNEEDFAYSTETLYSIATASRSRPTVHIEYNLDPNGNVFSASPLVDSDGVIGIVVIISAIQPIHDLTNNYTGLGQSGEALLAQHDAEGNPAFITPRRFHDQAAFGNSVPHDRGDIPMVQALRQKEIVLVHSVDYREVPVLAATRYIDEAQWGIVIKKDLQEVLAPLRSLVYTLLMYLCILVSISWLAAGWLARKYAKPVANLASVSQSIAEGAFETDVPITQDIEEIAVLQTSFSRMKNTLQQSFKELELFQQAVDAAGEAIDISTADTKLIYINPAWVKLNGYPPEDTMGMKASFIRSPKCDQEERKRIRKLVSKGEECTSDAIINRRKDGSDYEAEMHIFPIKIEGRTEYFVRITRDISERKRTDRAKSEFISLASHQLRTPLTAIRWIMQMFGSGKGGSLTERQAELMQDAHDCTVLMSETIGTMLTLSRFEAGRMKVLWEESSLHKICEAVYKEHRHLAHDKKLDYVFEAGEDVTIHTDPSLLRECLSNLVSNAIKYSPRSETVSLEYHQEHDHVVLTVADTGYGIPKKQQKKIFSKFFRAENILDKSTEGTGLGLYLVHSIVTLLRGTVCFVSEEGHGTTFTITLPISHHD